MLLLRGRPTPSWPPLPNQDSLARCKCASASSVQTGYLIYVMINTLYARNVAIRYVVMILFAMNVVHGLPTFAECT